MAGDLVRVAYARGLPQKLRLETIASFRLLGERSRLRRNAATREGHQQFRVPVFGESSMHEDREIRLRDVMTLLRRRWKLIAGCALAGALLAALIGMNTPPRYTAKAQLLVARSDAGPTEILDEVVVDTHVELILSPSHLREVQASLAEDPGSGVIEPPVSPLAALLRRGLDKLDEFSASMLSLAADDDLQGAQMAVANDKDTSELSAPFDFETLKMNLNVYKEQRSRVVAVTFTAEDPQTAALIANRVAHIYVQRGRDQLLARREKIEQRLAERIPSAQAALDRAEVATRAYRIASGLLDDKSAETLDRQIAALKQQLAVDTAELQERDTRLAALRGREDGDGPLVEVLRSDRPPTRFEIRADLEAEALDTSPRVDPGQPQQKDRLVAEAIAKLSADRSAIVQRVGHTHQRLASLEQSRERMRESEAKLRELERTAATAAQLYESLLRRQTEHIAEEGIQQEAHIISAALPPEHRSSPSPVLFVLPALVAFGLGGGLSAVMIERFDRRVRSERDVEEAVGVPCIGLIPTIRRWRMRQAQRALIDRPFNIYAEAIRSVVVTALLRRCVPPPSASRAASRRLGIALGGRQGTAGRGALPRRVRDSAVFAVTSSEQDDGKTTLALSFAISAATLGRKVLLIDLDLRSHGVTHLSGRSGKNASPTMGKDALPVEELVRTRTKLGIDHLALSHRHEYALSFLSANHLSDMLNRLTEKYDCIVIDSPPLLSATEARLIASLADNIIFALRWTVTDADVARQALRQLQLAGIKDTQRRVFGVVTQVNIRKHNLYRYGEV